MKSPIIDSYSETRKTAILCPSFHPGNIELQELTHAEGKPCILYCDMTEAELQKRLLERTFNVSKSNFHIFTSSEASDSQQVLKFQNLTLSYYKIGYRLRLGNTIM